MCEELYCLSAVAPSFAFGTVWLTEGGLQIISTGNGLVAKEDFLSAVMTILDRIEDEIRDFDITHGDGEVELSVASRYIYRHDNVLALERRSNAECQ